MRWRSCIEPPKITYATVEYLDFPAISKENAARSQLIWPACAWWMRWRMCCAYSRTNGAAREGSVDPVRDFEDVEMELILSDLVVVEKRLERVDKDRKKIKNPELDQEFALLSAARQLLEANTPLRELEFDGEDEKRIRGFQFLSQKPMLCVLNLGEEDAAAAARSGGGVSQRPARRHSEHRRHGGLRQDRSRAGRAAARGGGGISDELRTEGIRPAAPHHGHLLAAGADELSHGGRNRSARLDHSDNSTAVKAAGAIHTDFEKKFIRAEVVNWKTLIDHSGYPGVREKGLLRLEGKEYIVKDGDVLVIRHS